MQQWTQFFSWEEKEKMIQKEDQKREKRTETTMIISKTKRNENKDPKNKETTHT